VCGGRVESAFGAEAACAHACAAVGAFHAGTGTCSCASVFSGALRLPAFAGAGLAHSRTLIKTLLANDFLAFLALGISLLGNSKRFVQCALACTIQPNVCDVGGRTRYRTSITKKICKLIYKARELPQSVGLKLALPSARAIATGKFKLKSGGCITAAFADFPVIVEIHSDGDNFRAKFI
jgi:hypothetical protein